MWRWLLIAYLAGQSHTIAVYDDHSDCMDLRERMEIRHEGGKHSFHCAPYFDPLAR